MRRVAVALLCLALALTPGCGSQGATPAATPDGSVAATTVPDGQRALDALEDAFPDESIAAAAVLLAADQGYGLVQIVDAAVAGRLAGDGRIVGEDGAALPPDGPPAGLLVDDLAEVRARNAVMLSSRSAYPVSEVISFLEKRHPEHGPLLLVLALLDSGYDAEQITLAVMTDGSTRFDEQAFGYYLLDADGAVITPAGPRLGVMLDAVAGVYGLDLHGDGAGDGGPATGPPDPGPVTTPSPAGTDQLADLVARAVGEYELTDGLAQILRGVPGIDRLDSYEGEMTVTPDGRASGGFSYTFTSDSQFGPHQWTIRVVLPSSTLEVLDDGLTFSVAALVDEPLPDGAVNRVEQPATGYVDVDLGLITVAFGDGYDVPFQRVG